jgi:hypothetical protein
METHMEDLNHEDDLMAHVVNARIVLAENLFKV